MVHYEYSDEWLLEEGTSPHGMCHIAGYWYMILKIIKIQKSISLYQNRINIISHLFLVDIRQGLTFFIEIWDFCHFCTPMKLCRTFRDVIPTTKSLICYIHMATHCLARKNVRHSSQKMYKTSVFLIRFSSFLHGEIFILSFEVVVQCNAYHGLCATVQRVSKCTV